MSIIHRLSKRNNGTSCENGTYYKFFEDTYTSRCSGFWPGNELAIRFTPDLPSCLNECARWNLENLGHCVGAVWGKNKEGPPEAPPESKACYLKWKIGQFQESPDVDSGSLNEQEVRPSVYIFLLTIIAHVLHRYRTPDNSCA